jgi:hypothetical protein
MIFEISQTEQQKSPTTTTNEFPVCKIDGISEFLSPEQQRSLITATPVQKVAVLSPVKKENTITEIVL